jgi:hypothetical protein
MTAYSIELYEERHKRQIAQLQKQLWGLSPVANQKYLEWKYEQNPYTPDPLIYVAVDQGRVIGMRGIFGASWEVQGERTQMAIPSAADSLVDRQHRDTRIFDELTEFAFDDLRQRGYSHVLNLSPTPANYVTSVMTMGWRPIGSVQMVHLPSWRAEATTRIRRRFRDVDVARTLLHLSRRIRAAMPANGFAHLERLAAGRGPDEYSPITIADEPRPRAMEDLVVRADSQRGIRHLRNETFFEWRFRNPRANYRYLFWDEAETLSGYLVLGNPIGNSNLYIADWEAADPDVLIGLMQAALTWTGRRQDIETWSGTLSPERMTVLARAGFAEKPTTSRYSGRLLIHSLRDAEGESPEPPVIKVLEDIQSWDLRMIYSDAF